MENDAAIPHDAEELLVGFTRAYYLPEDRDAAQGGVAGLQAI
jgi:hypothetical protein